MFTGCLQIKRRAVPGMLNMLHLAPQLNTALKLKNQILYQDGYGFLDTPTQFRLGLN
jgi:hypothetical protein